MLLLSRSWLLFLLIPLQCFCAYRFADHILDEDLGAGTSGFTASFSDGPNDVTEDDVPLHRRWQPETYLADISPPTASAECYRDDWTRSDWYLSLFWNENAGFSKRGDDRHAFTYGEVTPLGVRQLAYEMGIASEECSASSTKDVVFYDLGSGVGRLVTQMYFDQPRRIRQAIGVELALDRHEIAKQALMDIQSMELVDGLIDVGFSVEDASFPIVLLQGDALNVDWSKDATHVFMSSLCFPKHVLESLQMMVLNIPKIQVVAALNRLDVLRRLNFWEEREVQIQMSWGPGVAKIYQKVMV